MQGTWVRALGQEDSTCRGATKTMSRNYWSPRATTTEACAPTAHALQQEKPLQWEAHALQRTPHLPQLETARVQQWRPNTAKNKNK